MITMLIGQGQKTEREVFLFSITSPSLQFFSFIVEFGHEYQQEIHFFSNIFKKENLINWNCCITEFAEKVGGAGLGGGSEKRAFAFRKWNFAF